MMVMYWLLLLVVLHFLHHVFSAHITTQWIKTNALVSFGCTMPPPPLFCSPLWCGVVARRHDNNVCVCLTFKLCYTNSMLYKLGSTVDTYTKDYFIEII